MKKIFFYCLYFISVISHALEVNKTDAPSLESLPGIGPALSQAILSERNNGGDFKDWADFESRVKGMKSKKALQLSNKGLTIQGLSRPHTTP